MGYAGLKDMQAAGQKIKSFEEWKVEMLRLAEIAVSEGRLINAAFYCRASEFFMTREENAQNHCQIGNTGLKLDIVMQWIEKYT